MMPVLWSGPTSLVAHPTVAAPLTIVSTSTDDAPGGIGAHSFRLYYIDFDWLFKTVELEMNGTTPVQTPEDCFRLNRIRILSAGTANACVGTITCSIGGLVQAQLNPGGSSTNKLSFSVGRNELAHIYALSSSIAKVAGNPAGAQATLAVHTHHNVDDPSISVAGDRYGFGLHLGGVGTIDSSVAIPQTIFGPADVDLRCVGLTDNGTDLTGTLRVLFEDISPVAR